MRWELIDGAKHPNPQAVYRWLNSKIRAIHFSPGVDGWTYASTIIGTLILFETLSNVLVFFSLEALFLRKALAQIFSVLWPSLLGR
jgi:hypothetical protein